MSTDPRTLPQHDEAERSVLGAILLHADRLHDATEHLEPAHFYRVSHQRIFAAMRTLAEQRVEIDGVTVKHALAKAGQLEEVGGPAYLAALVDGMPRGTNVGAYARIVREKADLRAVIFAAQQMIADAYAAEDETRELLDRAEQQLFTIAQGQTASGFRKLSAIIPGVMESIETWCRTKQGVSGVASGFDDLDAMTRGFQPGNLIILAARPAMGKSALAMNIAQHVAREQTVAIFSLEMSESELAVRTLTAAAGIDGHRLQRGFVRESEWARLADAIGELSALRLFIDESPFLTTFDMRSRARRLKTEHGLALLIVDYTQLLIGHERRENRTLELGAISRALKGLAKDLKIPVLALSQLSRKVEERTDKRPMLSDLRESGALEQDADVVLFIYRESVYRETEENRHRAEVIIGKQRNGPIGTVPLAWLPEQTRFANYRDVAQPEDQRLPMGDR